MWKPICEDHFDREDYEHQYCCGRESWECREICECTSWVRSQNRDHHESWECREICGRESWKRSEPYEKKHEYCKRRCFFTGCY